jgi:hypothetical protein
MGYKRPTTSTNLHILNGIIMSDEIQRALGRIEGKLDTVLSTQEKHEEQISSLEMVKTQALTLVGIFSVGIPLLWETIKTALKQ